MLVVYTATVHWGVGGGMGVSVGGVSQLRPLDVFEPLSSESSSLIRQKQGHTTSNVTVIPYLPLNHWSDVTEPKLVNKTVDGS